MVKSYMFLFLMIKTYRKVFVPRDPSSDLKLEVKVGFDVIDIVEINEPKVSMTEFRHILFFTNNTAGSCYSVP